MCLGLGLLERVTGQRAAAKAARKSAKQAEEQALLQAQGSQDQLETNIAQQAAAAKAKELLDVPIESTDVEVGTTSNSELDPATGRRRSARSRFQMEAASGLQI